MTLSAIDLRNRHEAFAALEAGTFDILVIGAGITGAGVARDAAARGLKVALVDANDFGSGTSSRSSKLIHGGMRYLAAGQIAVVREAATERTTLRRIAPHLAQTTRMVIPARNRKSLFALKAAMVAYEKLGKVAPSERHEMWDVARIEEEEPTLNTDGLIGAAAYPEYVTDDGRLTLGNVRSAFAHGATIVSYAAVTEILLENGKACGALVQSTLQNENSGARVKARVVVNAAGPWLDAVRNLEDAGAPQKLQLTKGIHLVFDRDFLPVKNTVIIAGSDKRSTFVVPRGRFAYMGTTDTFYPEAEYWPKVTSEDIQYLLEPLQRTFRIETPGPEDIVSIWSGVRPLLAQEGKSPSDISRRHECLEGPAGVLSIAGGKLTSYRSMAKRIVDQCQKILGQTLMPSITHEETLPGGDLPDGIGVVEEQLRKNGMNESEAQRAARLYGSEAAEVFAQGAGPEAEARFAVLKEGALTLEDYWARRSSRAHFDDAGGTHALEPASITMAGLLGWDEATRQAEVEACLAIRNEEMSALMLASESPT